MHRQLMPNAFRAVDCPYNYLWMSGYAGTVFRSPAVSFKGCFSGELGAISKHSVHSVASVCFFGVWLSVFFNHCISTDDTPPVFFCPVLIFLPKGFPSCDVLWLKQWNQSGTIRRQVVVLRWICPLPCRSLPACLAGDVWLAWMANACIEQQDLSPQRQSSPLAFRFVVHFPCFQFPPSSSNCTAWTTLQALNDVQFLFWKHSPQKEQIFALFGILWAPSFSAVC